MKEKKSFLHYRHTSPLVLQREHKRNRTKMEREIDVEEAKDNPLIDRSEY